MEMEKKKSYSLLKWAFSPKCTYKDLPYSFSYSSYVLLKKKNPNQTKPNHNK